MECEWEKVSVEHVMKCPLCNSVVKKREYKNRISSMRAQRSKKTLDCIDDIISKVDSLTGLTEIEIYYFMLEMQDIQGIIIRKMSELFESRGYLEQGYGLKYLIGMIKGENSRYNLKQDYEKKTLDRIPPKLKDEDEEY